MGGSAHQQTRGFWAVGMRRAKDAVEKEKR
jgi:hypothetical protein